MTPNKPKPPFEMQARQDIQDWFADTAPVEMGCSHDNMCRKRARLIADRLLDDVVAGRIPGLKLDVRMPK